MKKILLPLFLSTLACAAQAATITVNNSTDGSVSGACTLRNAVQAINNGSDINGCTGTGYGSGDTIVFASSLAGETIGVEAARGGEIEIAKDLIIDASSLNGGITLNANLGQDTPGNNRILNATGNSLTITGVRFVNGKADNDNGGAVLAYNTVIISNSTFEGNQATSTGGINGNGGAVYASGTATISNSTFEGNQATSTRNINSDGGAVYASGTTTISDSTFKGNQAKRHGGAVYAGGTATISNSTFEGNHATGRIANGGAVYAVNAAIISNNSFKSNQATSNGGAVQASTATISSSSFEGNQANSYGGAVHTFTVTTISDSSFEGNQARSGGAVYVNTATIINSTFEGNSASGGGGAVVATIATISNSSFEGNEANGSDGGAVVRAGSKLDARHLTLLGNTAPNGSGQALRVWDRSGSATLHNSIIIGTDGNDADQCFKDGGTFTGSHNLEGWVNAQGVWQAAATSCGSAITTLPVDGTTSLDAIVATAPADNGGPTKTLKLPTGSPAIGAADPTTGGTSQMWDFSTSEWIDATLDQRVYPRSDIALGRDLGAYEDRRTPSPLVSDDTPIPALPAPLLLLLAAAAGLLGRRHLRQRRR